VPAERIILALTAVSAGLPSALTFDYYTKEKPEYLRRAILSSAFVVLTVVGALYSTILMFIGLLGIAGLYAWSIWKALRGK